MPELKKKHLFDFCIANSENAAGGFGLTREIAQKIYHYKVDVQTSGNHIWDRREIVTYLDATPKLLRPANYPEGTPGFGYGLFDAHNGSKVGVINLMGRTFMADTDCPFRKAESILKELKDKTKIIIVDFHAEATSEKQSMGWFLDGRVSAVIGTHTHVQTADERIFPGGTAFITDVGMTGPYESVIGVRKEDALERFLTQLPKRMALADKDVRLCGLLVEIDPTTGQAQKVERLNIPVEMDASGAFDAEQL